MIKTILILITVSLVILFGSYLTFNYLSENGSFNRTFKPMDPEEKSEIIEENITKKGTLICLPHKNTEGPQTMECAFGLKDEKGLYYALNDPEWKFLIGPAMNTSVTVTGTLERKSDTKYNSVGIIKLTNLVKHN